MTAAENTTNSPEIIDEDSIQVLYQPIISIQERRVYGVEALSRGGGGGEKPESARNMFDSSRPAELRYKLDVACATKALKGFKKFAATDPRICLFLNVDPNALLECEGCADFLEQLLTEHKVDPKKVVIEIHAGLVGKPGIQRFIRKYKELGCKLSIDHVVEGAGLLEILMLCRPDFMKFEYAVWENPADDTYNMDNIKLITRTCQENGCLPLALGMENEDDTLYLLLCGFFHHQGYYYTRNKNISDKSGDGQISSFSATINHIHDRFKKMRKDNIVKKREQFKEHLGMTKALLRMAEEGNENEYDTILKRFVNARDDVISAFILDGEGKQITSRPVATKLGVSDLERRHPALRRGADHAIEEYFLHIEAGFERYVGQESISVYTKQRSHIISRRLLPNYKEVYVLCVEVRST